MAVTIYHNPRCSKSRATLALLTERGIDPVVVRYLETPPAADTLRGILAMLGLGPRDIMRRKEAAYRAADLDDPDLDDEQLIAAIVDNPVLLERPIVVSDGRAAIGRPPETVLEIL